MKRIHLAVLVAVVAATPIAASAEWVRQGISTQSISHPDAKQSFQIAAVDQMAGKVIESVNAGGYTYVNVDTGARVFWAAAPQFVVEVGEHVVVPSGALMQGYYSKTLDRTFDEVYFVGAIEIEGREGRGVSTGYSDGAAAEKSHDRATGGARTPSAGLSGIAKADGGKTIGEIFDERSALSGQEVQVRAKVVKYSPRILGTNWIHIQDETSGSGGENDLTVTTSGSAEVGSTVLIRGKVILEKDFGYGYKYDVMIENAEIIVE